MENETDMFPICPAFRQEAQRLILQWQEIELYKILTGQEKQFFSHSVLTYKHMQRLIELGYKIYCQIEVNDHCIKFSKPILHEPLL